VNAKRHTAATVKPVYQGHTREPENVAFMSSYPLYTGYNYMHYSLMGKMRMPFIVICYIEVPFIVICYIEVPFIDSDLLYRGALSGRFDCIYISLMLINII
jgi:hypothetical protein